MTGEPLSILQVFNQYRFAGGEEEFVNRSCAALERDGRLRNHRLLFRSSDWQGPGRPSAIGQALRMFYNPASVASLRVAQECVAAQAFVFHNIYPVGSAGLYREALRRRIPVIQFIHNFRPFSVSGYLWADGRVAPNGLRRRYRDEIRHGAWQASRLKTAWGALVFHALHRSGWLRSVQTWVAVSAFMKERFIEAGIAPERIRVLHHFWDPLSAPPAPRDQGFYLFLGSLVDMKGVKVLLDVWDMLQSRLGTRCPTLLIGGEGPLKAMLTDVTIRHPRIRFAGYIGGPDKAEALASCRAVLAPSLSWEALGLMVYEAYDNGKPVLAARSGGLPENIVHDRTGWLHTPGDARQLADQIVALEREPGLAQTMGSNGRLWLVEHRAVRTWLDGFACIVRDTIRDQAW